MKKLTTILILIILLPGCESEEKLITGTVTGKVVALSSYHKYLSNLEGVTVNLYRDTVAFSSVLTNNLGRFYFKGVPYGRYYVRAYKEKFVPEYGSATINHAGGSSPTMQDAFICEIPAYQITVDSLGYDIDEHYIRFFLTSDTVVPGDAFRAFADSVSDVTKDKYVSAGRGYFTRYYPYYPTIRPVYGRIGIWDFDVNIGKLKSDTIYLRIYPTADGQGYDIMQFYPEALGKPSNVVKFLWNDLIQNKR